MRETLMIRKTYWLLGLALCLLVSCQSSVTDSSPLPTATSLPSIPATPTAAKTATPVELTEGNSGIKGRVLLGNNWAGRAVNVYAAPFYDAGEAGEGFFVLEPSIHPSTELDPDGSFALVNIEPRSYVLVIGPNPDDARTLQEAGTTEVFEATPNQVLDIGTVRLP